MPPESPTGWKYECPSCRTRRFVGVDDVRKDGHPVCKVCRLPMVALRKEGVVRR